jgi:hypothetical protein
MWALLHSVAWGYSKPGVVIRCAGPDDGPVTSFFRPVLAAAGLMDGDLLRRDACEDFFEALVHVLPCGSCCKNYEGVITGQAVKGVVPSAACLLRPGVFDSWQALTTWLYNVHNCNRVAHGKTVIMDYAAARARYGSAAARRRLRIWQRPLWDSVLFVAWSFPVRPSAAPERAAANVRFLRSLHAVLPPDAPLETHAAAQALDRTLGRMTAPTRAAVTRAVTRAIWAFGQWPAPSGATTANEFHRVVCAAMAERRGV